MHRNSGRLWPSLLGADDSFLKCSLDLTNGMLGCAREHDAESPLSKTKTTEGKRIETLNSSLVFETF